MFVQHNMMALNASRSSKINETNQLKCLERLNTGYKVNRAADNAAGLSISEKMRAMIKGLDQASRNVEDGMSLTQVADGALSEVHSIINRMRELSVQAANDTNVEADREAIQLEIEQLQKEIDRIGDETEFNTMKLFTGGSRILFGSDGLPIDVSQIPFSNFRLSDMELEKGPFSSSSGANTLNLVASTTGDYEGLSWNLIFGGGSTSKSNVRMSYTNDEGEVVTLMRRLEEMSISEYNYDETSNEYSRVFSFSEDGMGLRIRQIISIGENNGTSQYYNISYEIENIGDKPAAVDFLFNADTAYNNDDNCEGYYINNQKVRNNCVYTNNQEYKDQSSYAYDSSGVDWSNGFSIIDTESALPFSENIRWNAADMPDTISFGRYDGATGDCNWDYYDSLDDRLGGSTTQQDSTFSFIWNRNVESGGTTKVSFQYGIVATERDANLTQVEKKYMTGSQVHTSVQNLWIQSGANSEQGIKLRLEEMNTGVLGIRELSMMSHVTAGDAISKLDKAEQIIAAQRSHLGAQTNRMEHNKAINDVTAENLQQAESRIRDADMADEVVEMKKSEIIQQATMSLLAQANQLPSRIVELLS